MTTYTLSLVDSGGKVTFTNPGDNELVIPTHAAVPIPARTSFFVRRALGAGPVTITPPAGGAVNAPPGHPLIITSEECELELTIIDEATDTWDLKETGGNPINIGGVTVESGSGDPTRADRVLGALYIQTDLAQLWQFDGSTWLPMTGGGGGGGGGGAAGGLIGVQTITATGPGVYTPTAGTVSVIIELQGAGGGGAAALTTTGNFVLGNGGGGGAWLRKKLTADFSGANYSVGAKGAGGPTGGSAPGSSGTAGGATTFTTTSPSSVTYTAGGGFGGAALGPVNAPLPAGGTSGGSASGGTPDMAISGGAAQTGIATSASRGTSSGGGVSRYSSGGPNVFTDGLNPSVAGTAADGYGGGGGGAFVGNTGANKAGGAGSNGLIVIWEFS